VVDDEPAVADSLRDLLNVWGYETALESDGIAALNRIEGFSPAVVISDVRMPRLDGFGLLREIRARHPEIAVIMLTGQGSIEMAVRALQDEGAYHYFEKPIEDFQKLRVVLERAVEYAQARRENEALRRQLRDKGAFGELIGNSPAMREIFTLIEQVAPSSASVLITGESGTGKELVAKSIHESSLRADKPFVVVNCTNIPSELLESELFGHTKGAFTGAVSAKKGLFEVADTGSIFLDEIGDLRPETQVRLLRVIQEREFTPVGETTPVKVDVRIIAATNVDLKEAVKNGTFREDLYYRLSVVPIELPPLRTRREDILPLVQHFIGKYNEENARVISENLSPEVLSLLENYYYPGNVRELENIIERAVVIAPTDEITVECLRPEVRDPDAARALTQSDGEGSSEDIDISRGVNFYDEVRRFETDLIRRSLDQTGGHQSRAARLLGLNATTLNSKIKSYNILPRA